MKKRKFFDPETYVFMFLCFFWTFGQPLTVPGMFILLCVCTNVGLHTASPKKKGVWPRADHWAQSYARYLVVEIPYVDRQTKNADQRTNAVLAE
jgi:hypothetical protein